MALSLVLTTLLLATTSFAQYEYIKVINYQSTSKWYLTIILENIDASICGETISSVQVYENDAWRSNDQYYWETDAGHRYAWNHNGIDFDAMLPISIQIVMNTGREIPFWGIITDMTPGSEFTTTDLICDGTLPPTPPSSAPTTSSPTPPTTAYPTAATICISEDNMEWRSYDNEIKLNGNRFNMKGLSWFGFETVNDYVYGTDIHDVDWYLEWIVDNGFNAIRLPFSKQFIDSSKKTDYLDVVQKAGAKGLLVMPDLHSISKGAYTEGLPTEAQMISAWETMIDLVGDEWNIFIADIFNEPHDVSNDGWGDFITKMENVADAIWAKGVNWLVAVEGTNWQCEIINCAWGENLQGVRNKGITFDNTKYGANRFIWSPHVYGSDVTGNPHSEAAWQAHWGYLHDGTDIGNDIVNVAAQAVGEFGTRYNDATKKTWMDDLITYLIKIDQRNTFFWCLNPNSGDTGGLLKDDWTTPETAKLTALDVLQPNPSKITYNSNTGTVCITGLGDGSITSTPTTDTPAPVPSPTYAPTTESPTYAPSTVSPSKAPTGRPTKNPSQDGDTAYPSSDPTKEPTASPVTKVPTASPVTKMPTIDKSEENPTEEPSPAPNTQQPTEEDFDSGEGSGVERNGGLFTFGVLIVYYVVVNML